MYEWVLPDLLIPVHGEYRHLDEHIKFSKECGIKNQMLVENGNLVKVSKNEEKRIILNVSSGRKVLRGNQIIPLEDKFLKGLDSISSSGEIFVNLIMNSNDELLTDPVIFCPSLLIDEQKKEEIKNMITKEISNLSNNFINDDVLNHDIKIKVRSFLKSVIGLKPLTVIEIVRI